MKHCNKCNTDKPYKEFNKEKKNRDGFCSVCRDCMHNYQRTRGNRAVARLKSRLDPNVDDILLNCAKKIASELHVLNQEERLSGNDITKMNSMIKIMLDIRKQKIKPVEPKPEVKEEEKPEPVEDVFE